MAALSFASDTLKTGGRFVCKFYQGAEDKAFETKLKKMFRKVHREKPESSRSVRYVPPCRDSPFLLSPFVRYAILNQGLLCPPSRSRRRHTL